MWRYGVTTDERPRARVASVVLGGHERARSFRIVSYTVYEYSTIIHRVDRASMIHGCPPPRPPAGGVPRSLPVQICGETRVASWRRQIDTACGRWLLRYWLIPRGVPMDQLAGLAGFALAPAAGRMPSPLHCRPPPAPRTDQLHASQHPHLALSSGGRSRLRIIGAGQNPSSWWSS